MSHFRFFNPETNATDEDKTQENCNIFSLTRDLFIFRYATIAYVQQTPWLMKTTIRENILFGEAYRPRRYEKVLVSCALKEDLRCLPEGDLTEIGTNSINLSGGQRSRIAIARALYSSANVVIMVKYLIPTKSQRYTH